jgi:hypothetical protein
MHGLQQNAQDSGAMVEFADTIQMHYGSSSSRLVLTKGLSMACRKSFKWYERKKCRY